MAHPSDHDRFDYSAIVDRPPLRWPNGARVAVWVIPNIEHFLFDRPSTSITAVTAGFVPDVLNYSWRDYGVRVGIWRMMDIMQRHGVRGTVALNADVCERYPRIIEAGNSLGWEWMGHGRNNSDMLAGKDEAAERAVIASVAETIARGTGRRPRGWLGPALTETHNTPDLLAEAGFDYVCDWVNDEQPYPMRVKSGTLTSIPYSAEINDIPAILDGKQSAETFGRMIRDQFDVLYEDGATTGRVMSICLHPFVSGHPFRAKYLDQALAHIAARQEVWLATGAEIVDWYRANA
jgi:peptidoglycan/xylan/chitin deacetylase (PgdA/CDA1 family)